MDVREKLIELLADVGLCHYTTIADHLIANGVTVQENTEITDELLEQLRNAPVMVMTEEPNVEVVQEWISTDERMPMEDDATDGYVAVVYDWGDGVKTKTISLVDVVIAHPDLYDYWMPLNLPQPPKGE